MSGTGPELPTNLNAVEARLRRLRPAGPALDRDAVLFAAGRASAASARLPLLGGAAALALVAMGLSGAWWTERTRRASVEMELASLQTSRPLAPPHELDEPPAPIAIVDADPDSYLALRQLIAEGLDAPRPPSRGVPRDGYRPIKSPESRPLRARDLEFDL
jgi:hypothetical protein